MEVPLNKIKEMNPSPFSGSRWVYGLMVILIILLPFRNARAEQDGTQDTPWEKIAVNLGVLVSNVDSSVRLGTGSALDIDMEKLLELEASNTVFRTDAVWRFSENLRHRLDVTWLAFRREATREVSQGFTIEDDSGNTILIDTGSTVISNFDLDIYALAYSYSFLQDERVDLAALLGVYVMPIDISIGAFGATPARRSVSFTAPLPVIGMRMDVALAPRWFIRSGSQLFYLEYGQFKGSLLEFRTALEYTPWRHVGFGLGFDSLAMAVEAEDEDYPVDFKGNLDFRYTGIQWYIRLFF